MKTVREGLAGFVLGLVGMAFPSGVNLTAAQAGTKRRLKREEREHEARAILYANTPESLPSRQVKRKEARQTAKRAATRAKIEVRRTARAQKRTHRQPRAA